VNNKSEGRGQQEVSAPLQPTHRCKVCGARWRLHDRSGDSDGSWQLLSEKCGPCCDNAPMEEQIEPLRIPPPPDGGLRFGPIDQRTDEQVKAAVTVVELRALVAELANALEKASCELGIAASYAQSEAPTAGIRIHAQACAKILPEIDALITRARRVVSHV
jgi:hypothetical protein